MHPLPSTASAPQTAKPPLVVSTSRVSSMLCPTHVPSPRAPSPAAHVPSELLTTYRIPRCVKPPDMSARPQCQITRPGSLSAFVHAVPMPPGGAHVTVLSWFVNVGGVAQPSTHTTSPARVYLFDTGSFVGQPG